MKQKKNQIICLVVLAILAVFLVMSFQTPGQIAYGENYTCRAYSTIFSLLPPIISIILAQITKEVYSSLFVGIVAGALLYANGNLELMINTMLFNKEGGMIFKLVDPWNVCILIFPIILGILVTLMNRVGGTAAFGNWASNHIHTHIGAQLVTVFLGVLIFIDDYFNCLTVGNVMRPITDRHQVSRAKLAYLIDATAAPVCSIAPISSWAVAVTSCLMYDSNINGFMMFLKTIPYNYYAILTLIMVVFTVATKIDYGSMRAHEKNAIKGDLFSAESRPYGKFEDDIASPKGNIIDFVFPVTALILYCIISIVYTGGFFEGVDFVTAFANSDASVGLVLGSFCTLIITFLFYMFRNVITFEELMDCIPEGFKTMVSPILILTMAWTLSGMTNLLGANFFVSELVNGLDISIQAMFPAMIFIVAAGLAFSSGTSWGTFGILIPIVCSMFSEGEMQMISISACLAGCVCGDHCSPISDTTIMASVGAQCDHINHVSTQLPYALTVAIVSMVVYLLAGFMGKIYPHLPINLICLPIAVLIMLITLIFIKMLVNMDE